MTAENVAATAAKEPVWLRIVDRISIALAVAGGIGAVLLVANIVANVVSRTATGVPLAGTLDISTYIWMPAVTVLAMGYALQRGEHIRVSLITGPASPPTQRIVEVASLALTILILAALTYYTFLGALKAQGIGESATGTPWLDIWPMRFVITVGLVGFLLQTAAEIQRAFVAANIDETEEVLL